MIPPIWKRTWFLATTILIVTSIIILIAIIITQRIKHIIVLDEFKVQFFTNISHELRTPLTVIIGPLESLVSKMKGHWSHNQLELALNNAKKMNRIVNQLLEFRKLETSTMVREYTHMDIVRFIKDEVQLTKPMADEKLQILKFDSSHDSHRAWFDPNKLEEILSNLISNAIK